MSLPPKEMYTFSEVAERWKVSMQTIEDYLLTDRLIASFFLKKTMLGKYTLVFNHEDSHSDDPYIYDMNFDYSDDPDFYIFESGIFDLCYKNLTWDEEGQTTLEKGFELDITWPHEEEGYYGLIDQHVLKRDDLFIALRELERFETENSVTIEIPSGQNKQLKVAATSSESAFELNPNSKKTLLKMVIAMAIGHYRYDPSDKKSDSPSLIKKQVERVGLSIDDETVRNWLKEAADRFQDELKINSKPNSV